VGESVKVEAIEAPYITASPRQTTVRRRVLTHRNILSPEICRLGSGVCGHQISIIGINPIEKQPDLVDQMHIRHFGNFRA
jgi:hypothetical protein